MFCQALRELDQPAPEVFAHLDLVDNPALLERVTDVPRLVRIDAAGENAAVERALLRLGYNQASAGAGGSLSPDTLAAIPEQRGQILAPHQHHLGFLSYLAALQEVFERRPSWRVLSPTRSIAELFDKRATSRRYAALGIPVPEVVPAVATPEELREAMRAVGVKAVFVKLSSGSSASCLAFYQLTGTARGVVQTTIRRMSSGWFNSLRVQRVERPDDVDEVLGFLLREGSQVERAVPKARLGKGFMDLRVLVVAGEPAFKVVRQNSHPITNLHLGGWRGDEGAFREAVPDDALAAAMASCIAVDAAHACFQLGVDLMFEPGFRAHRVLEANAFGDLLPRLQRDGLDVYQWQIRAAERVFTEQ